MLGVSDPAFAQRGRSSLTPVRVLAASGVKLRKKASSEDSCIFLKMKHGNLMLSFFFNQNFHGHYSLTF